MGACVHLISGPIISIATSTSLCLGRTFIQEGEQYIKSQGTRSFLAVGDCAVFFVRAI